MTDVLDQVLKTVANVKQTATGLSAGTEIASLELDSLDEVEIAMMLEDTFKIEINQTQFSSCRTLGDLSTAISAMR